MKKKNFHKYLLCFLAGTLVVGSISVYAASTIIDSKEVSYDNKTSKGSYDNVQLSIDELYQRYKDLSGEQDTIYKEEILNGTDPVLGDGMIPVTLDSKGTVKYANLYTPWYKYEEKEWANAVILVDNPSQSYKTGDTILEKDIESYFVWIPRYKYKIWDLGNYTKYYILSELKDTKDVAIQENDSTALRHLRAKARIIDVVFENKNTAPSTTQAIGSYYTHPAFINFDVNGFWMGKFTLGGSKNNILVKPNIAVWVGETVGTYWKELYSYRNINGKHNDSLDPHMVKNTEWGAAAYLSHSVYGKGSEVSVNNHASYVTGYGAAPGADQTTVGGTMGVDDTETQLWNTPVGHLASSTGNITGIYDMSGGAWEVVAAYLDQYGTKNKNNLESGLSQTDLTTYAKYFDVYKQTKDGPYDYTKRILGDATGEMGPFYAFWEKNGDFIIHNSWYADYAKFISSETPWFYRCGMHANGVINGQFAFFVGSGEKNGTASTRLALAVK